MRRHISDVVGRRILSESLKSSNPRRGAIAQKIADGRDLW